MNTNKSVILSSLQKVFPDSNIDNQAYTKFSMLKNEKSSFQIAIYAKKGDKIKIVFQSELSAYFHLSYIKMIPTKSSAPKNADDYYISKTKTEYPELLIPIENAEYTAEYDGYNTFWVEVKSNSVLPAGIHLVDITTTINQEKINNNITIEVIDALLPKQKLIFTNWFHTDCLMSYYKFDAFSNEYWRVVENFLKRAVEYGMNAVLTPLFTPPLDTKIGGERPTVQLVDVKKTGKNQYEFNFDKLDKWLEMCDRCGIEYYEMCHLFTQWGARHAPKIIANANGKEKKIFGWKTKASGRKYKTFIEQFAAAITKYIDDKDIREKCIFHVSDEPGISMLRTYKKASKIVHDNFKGFKIVDALSDFRLYEKGLIETPIPSNDHINKFIGKVPELWTYYCCAQGTGNVSNRFFSMPSQRNRVLGYQLYKYDVVGFLHWGFNFYYYQFAKGLLDPYAVTDAGGAFYSGDSYVVYPAKDGTPLNSLRLHVFYDAFQDMMALQLLESKLGKEKVVKILESNLDKPITFNDYPHDDNWQIETREKINQAIKENLE